MTDGAATEEPGSGGAGSGATEGRSTWTGAQRVMLTVVRGEPTPEQLAALIAVVGSRAAVAGPAEDAPPSPWSRPVLRAPLSPAPGAWRASALPR